MIVADLTHSQVRAALRAHGLRVRTGPVVTEVRSALDEVVDGIRLHYANHPVEGRDTFADFHVAVDRPFSHRRWFQRQVVFSFDGEQPFTPLPGDQGMPMLEWGMNWCVSNHCHQYLTVHAAVVERGGRALLLPAPPGSGKSTLCAGLAFSGWRLLSDELALIDPNNQQLRGLVRPISLKNASIDVLRRFAPQARLGPVVHETTKGSVAHVQAPPASVADMDRPAKLAWIVLPRHVADAPATLEPISRAEGFMQLVENSFNYHLYGARGFELLAAMVDACRCFRFTYGRLEDAVSVFAALADCEES
jgi:HprK-related kinase A